MSARLNNNQNEKSQASRFRGGLAFFVFQAAARQRNDLLNVRSIAPTIEAMKYRLWVKPRSALTERLSNNQSNNQKRQQQQQQQQKQKQQQGGLST